MGKEVSFINPLFCFLLVLVFIMDDGEKVRVLYPTKLDHFVFYPFLKGYFDTLLFPNTRD
jgi:hypothetical protein